MIFVTDQILNTARLKILKKLNRLIRALWLYKTDIDLFLIFKLHTQGGQKAGTAALPMPPPCSIYQNPGKTAVATLTHAGCCSEQVDVCLL